MQRANVVITGIALAITLAIVNSLCALLMALRPDALFSFVNSWAHGLDLQLVKATAPLTWGVFFSGLAGISITGFVIGVIYASTYNLLRTRDRRRPDEGLRGAVV